MKYEDYFDLDDANVEEMFNRLVRLLEDEVLYSGLKPEPASLPADSTIRVLTDFDFAITMAFDQQSPEFTGEYAEAMVFTDIVGDATACGPVRTREEDIAISRYYYKSVTRNGSYGFIEAYAKAVWMYVQEKGIAANLVALSPDWSSSDYSYLVEQLEVICDAFFFTAAAGGIHQYPVAKRMMECLEAGGQPTGWVGPHPEDGGDPETCMFMLHLGQPSGSAT